MAKGSQAVVVLALGRQSQGEHCEFEASLDASSRSELLPWETLSQNTKRIKGGEGGAKGSNFSVISRWQIFIIFIFFIYFIY